MKSLNSKHKATLTALTLVASTAVFFQNCGQNVTFESLDTQKLSSIEPVQPVDPVGDLGVCNGVSCDLTPLTNKPAVTTILLALGDEANNQLVVNGASAQLIAESVVRYTSPKEKPKVLLVHDQNSGSESAKDYGYAAKLLNRYDVTSLNEPSSGLTAEMLEGYDVIWFNNPGNPMGSSVSRDALIAFKGGVILQGDDLSWGKGFDNSSLTGLKYIDNGTTIQCGGVSYNTDNNQGKQFAVTLNPESIPGADASTIGFIYGNDIDNTIPARKDLEILAVAKGNVATCTQERPAIVRYLK